jgi:hypothetical protein
VSGRDCLDVIFPIEDMDHLFSAWTAVRSQEASEHGGANQHWVLQAAVLYQIESRGAQQPQELQVVVAGLRGSPITVTVNDDQYAWDVGGLVNDGDLIAQTSIYDGTHGRACQHAKSVASKAVAAKACGYRICGHAATIARAMIANAAN